MNTPSVQRELLSAGTTAILLISPSILSRSLHLPSDRLLRHASASTGARFAASLEPEQRGRRWRRHYNELSASGPRGAAGQLRGPTDSPHPPHPRQCVFKPNKKKKTFFRLSDLLN